MEMVELLGPTNPAGKVLSTVELWKIQLQTRGIQLVVIGGMGAILVISTTKLSSRCVRPLSFIVGCRENTEFIK